MGETSAMPTVTNTLVSPSDEPLVGYPVKIYLHGSQWTADGLKEIPFTSVWSGTTDVHGSWYAVLPAQSQYEGNTYYRVIEAGIGDNTFTLADSPSIQQLRSRLMSPIPLADSVGMSLDDLTDVVTTGAFDGQAITYHGGLWSPGTANATANPFVFIQSTPAATWPITHMLGHFPQVETVDGSGTRLIADVVYTGINSLSVIHGSPVTGSAYLL